jgi:hypothetical protein
VACLQAQNSTIVTNLRHERVDLTDTNRYYLLPYLDGSRDQAALMQILTELAGKGVIKESPHNGAVTDTKQTGSALAQMLESDLRQLAQAALLVG